MLINFTLFVEVILGFQEQYPAPAYIHFWIPQTPSGRNDPAEPHVATLPSAVVRGKQPGSLQNSASDGSPGRLKRYP